MRWIESTIRLPADQPEAWETVPYRFGLPPREILLARPRDPDRLLDDPAVQSASKSNDYMPYWAFVWPGALLLAERVLTFPAKWPPGARAAEIGCGLGLAGVAALAAGLHVTFSDYTLAALELASHNARLNGFTPGEHFETRLVDWSAPPRDPFDFVLGADVLYEPRCLPDVLRVLGAMLAPGGLALLSDPGRAVADPFEALARDRGYSVRTTPQAFVADSRTVRGRVFEVTRR